MTLAPIWWAALAATEAPASRFTRHPVLTARRYELQHAQSSWPHALVETTARLNYWQTGRLKLAIGFAAGSISMEWNVYMYTCTHAIVAIAHAMAPASARELAIDRELIWMYICTRAR